MALLASILSFSWCACFCGLRQMPHKPHKLHRTSDGVPKYKQACETQWVSIVFIFLHRRIDVLVDAQFLLTVSSTVRWTGDHAANLGFVMPVMRLWPDEEESKAVVGTWQDQKNESIFFCLGSSWLTNVFRHAYKYSNATLSAHPLSSSWLPSQAQQIQSII